MAGSECHVIRVDRHINISVYSQPVRGVTPWRTKSAIEDLSDSEQSLFGSGWFIPHKYGKSNIRKM
jgi:hypothetical protein